VGELAGDVEGVSGELLGELKTAIGLSRGDRDHGSDGDDDHGGEPHVGGGGDDGEV